MLQQSAGCCCQQLPTQQYHPQQAGLPSFSGAASRLQLRGLLISVLQARLVFISLMSCRRLQLSSLSEVCLEVLDCSLFRKEACPPAGHWAHSSAGITFGGSTAPCDSIHNICMVGVARVAHCLTLTHLAEYCRLSMYLRFSAYNCPNKHAVNNSKWTLACLLSTLYKPRVSYVATA